MSVADHLSRFFLLSFFVWNDVVRYPVPLPLLDREVISSTLVDFNHGICPFVVSPDFGQTDAHLDKHRKLSYNYQNSSLLLLKSLLYIENEVGRDPTTLFENMYQQLTASIPSIILQNVIKRLCVGVLITAASYLLYDSKQLDSFIERSPKEGWLLSFGASKVIFLFYVAGPLDLAVDNVGHFYFFLTVTTVTACMNAAITLASQMFEKALSTGGLSKYRRLKFACVAFSTLIAAFVIIAVCQTSQIDVSEIYTLLVVLEALILASRSWYVLVRISIGEALVDDNTAAQQKHYLFKLLIIYLGDLLEAITTTISIFFGLFIRRRLMVLLMVSHARRLIQRVLLFELPDTTTKSLALT